eukprot:10871-Heterococcus_DN1.PRE.3
MQRAVMLVSGVETQLHCSQLKTAVNASCYSHAQCDDRVFIYSNTGNNTASSTCLDYLQSAAGALTLPCAASMIEHVLQGHSVHMLANTCDGCYIAAAMRTTKCASSCNIARVSAP